MLYITYILYVYKYMYISSMSRYIDTFFPISIFSFITYDEKTTTELELALHQLKEPFSLS